MCENPSSTPVHKLQVKVKQDTRNKMVHTIVKVCNSHGGKFRFAPNDQISGAHTAHTAHTLSRRNTFKIHYKHKRDRTFVHRTQLYIWDVDCIDCNDEYAHQSNRGDRGQDRRKVHKRNDNGDRTSTESIANSQYLTCRNTKGKEYVCAIETTMMTVWWPRSVRWWQWWKQCYKRSANRNSPIWWWYIFKATHNPPLRQYAPIL